MPKVPSAERKPRLACLGTIASVSEPKPSKTEGSPYTVLTIELANTGTGPKKSKFSLLFIPGWFSPDFNPDNFASSGEEFVYKKHIQDSKGVSALCGLLGSPDAVKVFDAGTAELPNYDAETVGNFIRQALLDNDGIVGYELKQRATKTDQMEQYTDKQGNVKERVKYHLEPYYDVDAFFFADKRTANYHASRAAKDPDGETFALAYDPEVI